MSTCSVSTIKTDRFEMDYFRFGNGSKDFVIIPGVSIKPVSLSADAVAAGFSIFTEQYTVTVFDRIKHLPDEYSVFDMAEDTAEAMQLLGLRNTDIYGASQGGMIAMCIAYSHPELVHALYLASTAARISPLGKETMETWMRLAKAGDATVLNHSINTSVYSPEFYQKFASAFAMTEPEATEDEMRRLYILAKACRDFDFGERLNELRCRVFAVGAENDNVIGADATREIAEKLRCPLYIYDGYSHAVYDEAPDYRERMLQTLTSL